MKYINYKPIPYELYVRNTNSKQLQYGANFNVVAYTMLIVIQDNPMKLSIRPDYCEVIVILYLNSIMPPKQPYLLIVVLIS